MKTILIYTAIFAIGLLLVLFSDYFASETASQQSAFFKREVKPMKWVWVASGIFMMFISAFLMFEMLQSKP